MWRTKSMRSRPYALTEWLESRASQIQGTRAPAVVGASAPVAANAWARKASTLAAAGASPSRNSLRSGTRGTRGGAGSGSGFGRAGTLASVLVGFSGMVTNTFAAKRQIILKITTQTWVGKMGVHFASMLDKDYEHKADFVPSYRTSPGARRVAHPAGSSPCDEEFPARG